jgi:GNAT superfamily N-acetyltransferase
MIAVRRARPADAPELRRIFVDAGRAAWGGIVSPAALAALSPPDRWEDAIDAPDPQAVLVAESDGDIVGFAVIRPSGDDDAGDGVGEVDALYTHPDVWGLGAGRALLDAALAALAASGFREATLWTAEGNRRPRRVYEQYGWRLDGASRRRSLHDSTFVELRHRVAL